MEQREQNPGATDGKFYSLNDMVKAGCGDCEGCSACCRGMGSSIIVNPLDSFLITENLGKTFEELLAGYYELGVENGLILPHLKMREKDDTCIFLTQEGRCSIHGFRPGICRIFPLGRSYGKDGIQYIFLTNGCRKKNRTKVKVQKWIDTPDIRENERFLINWHFFCTNLQKKTEQGRDAESAKAASMYVLKKFYMESYEGQNDFYSQFQERLNQAQKDLGISSGNLEEI